MLNKVDEKGKVFTPRIRKMEVEVNIITVQGHVHGYLHIQPGQRVKDLLNNPAEQFLAITAATVHSRPEAAPKVAPKSGQSRQKADATEGSPAEQPAHADFLALNKQYVISVVPVDEDKVERPRDEEYYIPR
ncbi:MAG TPA: hypothetical protein VLQ48_15145 [Chloroflexia bacterium]|nr:hypothetical protein [Chloroflexia bacterium]